MKRFVLLAALLLFQWQALPVNNKFESPTDVTCACPGEVLTFTCIVDGGNVTIWGGSAFDCDRNEILLDHKEFNNGTSQECNDGAIVGQSVDINGTRYTSQLNVTVGDQLDNKTVNCSSDLDTYIGESLINVADHSAPSMIYLSDVQKGNLVFSWTPVAFDTYCSSMRYIITSDCGTCPTFTNMTTATCSDVQLTTNAVTCHFRVSSDICDLPENPSSPVEITLKVPNAPQVEIVPSYSNNSQALEMLHIATTMNQTEDLFNISNNISGFLTSYMAYVSNLISGDSFNLTVDLPSCDKGCEYPLIQKLPVTNICPQSNVINVSISAANKLGEGPHSNAFTFECTNDFVQVEYKQISSVSTISCTFLNPSDTSQKTCCATYQQCDRKETKNVPNCSNKFPYRIKLEVSNQMYCYTIRASNDTYTVEVTGNFTEVFEQFGAGGIVAITFAAIIVVVAIILSIILLIRLIIKCHKMGCRKMRFRSLGYQPLPTEDIESDIMGDIHRLKRYLIQYNLPSALKLHEVPSDCQLQEYITNVLSAKQGFRRGHTYYEFTNDIENILKGKEVLLQDMKKPDKWFQLDQDKVLAAGGLGLYGKGIARNNFGDQYRVFIQSFGCGARHLPGDSHILYNHSDDQVQPDVLPLVPVCSEHFTHKVINSEEECTVEDFCTQNRLNTTAFNIFLTVDHFPELERMRQQPPRDIILMKQKSKLLFTGPKARQMLDPSNGGEREKWKVFVLLDKNKQGLVLKKDSEILYQDSVYKTRDYSVLDVDEDCVRLSEFIEAKFNCKYKDGNAFYEVTEDDPEENLLYCKKILRPEVDKLGCEELKLESLVEYFYAIPGAPSKAVKPDKLKKGLQTHKIFIQSSSQGSRCLKRGTKLLYLKEYINAAQTCDHPDELKVAT